MEEGSPIGLSVSATLAVLGVGFLIVLGIVSGSLFRQVSDINYALKEVKDRAVFQRQSGINITNISEVGWWDSQWVYRKMIIINHSQVADDLTNFPVLIDIYDDDLADKALENGYDIAFVSNDNTLQFNHERELYFPPFIPGDTSHLIAWVNVTRVYKDIDTWFFMYYGSEVGDDQQNPEDVWDGNFTMVQHLEEIPEEGDFAYDSTANNNDGTPDNDVVSNSSGKIDSAYDFDGIGDTVNVTSSTSLAFYLTASYTWSALVYPQAASISQGGILYKGNGYSIYINSNHKLTFDDNNPISTSGSSTGTVPNDTWTHIAIQYSNKAITFFINGATSGTTTIGNANDASNDLIIGKGLNSGLSSFTYFNGTIDELRLSNIVRSASWINTSYNNQNSPNTFLYREPEQSQSFTYLNITVNNTGSENLKIQKWTVLINGNDTAFIYLQPYHYPEKITTILVNVTHTGTKRTKVITDTGKTDYESIVLS